jgi:hypothetical protein
VGSALKYTQEVTIDEFVSGAMALAGAAFSGDEAAVALAAVQMASDVIKGICGSGTIQTGFRGNAMRIRRNGKAYIAACYASTSVCSQTHWFTETDFCVSKFVFLIQEAKTVKLQSVVQKLKAA